MEAVRREIVVELERVQLVGKRAPTVMMFCQACWRQSDFVSLADAARIFDLRDIQATDFLAGGFAHVNDCSEKKFICTTAIISHLAKAYRKVTPKLIK